MKQILTFIITAAVSCQAAAQMPTRNWGDPIPRHSFSLTAGPAWFPKAFGALDLSGISALDIPRLGYDVELRYGWAYWIAGDSSLGIGLTYVFSSISSPENKVEGSRGRVKLRENFHIAGFNLTDMKVLFGKHLIWTFTMSMGYIGGTSWIVPDFPYNKVKEHGLTTGLSTGFGYLITPSLGMEMNLNFIYGLMVSSTPRDELMLWSMRFGAVYCF